MAVDPFPMRCASLCQYATVWRLLPVVAMRPNSVYCMCNAPAVLHSRQWHSRQWQSRQSHSRQSRQLHSWQSRQSRQSRQSHSRQSSNHTLGSVGSRTLGMGDSDRERDVVINGQQHLHMFGG